MNTERKSGVSQYCLFIVCLGSFRKYVENVKSYNQSQSWTSIYIVQGIYQNTSKSSRKQNLLFVFIYPEWADRTTLKYNVDNEIYSGNSQPNEILIYNELPKPGLDLTRSHSGILLVQSDISMNSRSMLVTTYWKDELDINIVCSSSWDANYFIRII